MDFEKNRDWANKINEELEHSNEKNIIDYFEDLEKRWKLGNNISNNFEIISNNFNINCLDNIDINFIETEKNKIIWEVLGVQNKFKKLVKLEDEEESNNYNLRWEKLIEKIYYAERLLRTNYLLLQTNKPHYSYELNEDTSALFKFVPISYEKNTSFQNLLLFLLEELSEAELQNMENHCIKKSS